MTKKSDNKTEVKKTWDDSQSYTFAKFGNKDEITDVLRKYLKIDKSEAEILYSSVPVELGAPQGLTGDYVDDDMVYEYTNDRWS